MAFGDPKNRSQIGFCSHKSEDALYLFITKLFLSIFKFYFIKLNMITWVVSSTQITKIWDHRK